MTNLFWILVLVIWNFTTNYSLQTTNLLWCLVSHRDPSPLGNIETEKQKDKRTSVAQAFRPETSQT